VQYTATRCNTFKGGSKASLSFNQSWDMTDSTENSIPQKSTKSRNSNLSVQIQSNQNLNLNLYAEIPKKSSCWNEWISGMNLFQWKVSQSAMCHRCIMGCLRSVGSIKSSFAEYCLFYRALFQKRPIILSILLAKATWYNDIDEANRQDIGFFWQHMVLFWPHIDQPFVWSIHGLQVMQ